MEPKCAGFNFQKSRSKCTLHETADNVTKSRSRDFIGIKLKSKKNVSLQMLEICAEKRREQRCSAEPKCMIDPDNATNDNNCAVGFQRDQYGCNLKPCRCAESSGFIVGDIIMPPEPKKENGTMQTFSRGFIPKGVRPSPRLSPRLWNQNYQNGKYIIPYRFLSWVDNWTRQQVRKASYSPVKLKFKYPSNWDPVDSKLIKIMLNNCKRPWTKLKK